MKFVLTWFRGEERLWKPFWLGGLLGMPIGIISGIFQVLGIIGIIISALLSIVYIIWMGVSIWNCAYNVDWEWWGHLARAWVILLVMMIIGFVVTFIFLF